MEGEEEGTMSEERKKKSPSPPYQMRFSGFKNDSLVICHSSESGRHLLGLLAKVDIASAWHYRYVLSMTAAYISSEICDRSSDSTLNRVDGPSEDHKSGNIPCHLPNPCYRLDIGTK